MAKKESSSKSFIKLPLLILLLGVGAAAYWYWDRPIAWKDHLLQYIENGEITTLESNYSPEQIMEMKKNELLGSTGKKTYQEPIYKYYPYLLLDVKYTEDKKSREGLLLWGFTDGEMVLNAETWAKTHGFKDCLDCKANRQDFKVMQTLARRGGSMSLDDLQKDMQVERDILESWIDDAKQKHLIIQKGSNLQLHFENPKLLVSPQTQIDHDLVSKPIQNGQKVSKNYSRNQIVEMAKAAFGNDFTIRSEQEIFLPVYTITVLNPDGSLHTTDWNAVTGQKISKF